MPASANQARYVKAELAGAGTYMIPMGHLVKGATDDRRSARRAFSLADLHSRFAIVLSPEAVI